MSTVVNMVNVYCNAVALLGFWDVAVHCQVPPGHQQAEPNLHTVSRVHVFCVVLDQLVCNQI